MKLFNNKSEKIEPVPDITFKLYLCPQHKDFCKSGTDKVQPQLVISLLRLITQCKGCKVVTE